MQHILKLFTEKVNHHPDAIAVLDKDIQLTYKQLDEYSTSVALHLQTLGISKGELVPLFMKPDSYLMITVLALYKLGAAYLPVSPKFPLERSLFLFEDSGSKFVITNTSLKINNFQIIDVTTIPLQNHVDIKTQYGELAYVIYTSGSTGRPKGVKVSHANLMNLVQNMQTYYPIQPGDRYLLTTPFTFDVSVCEIFGWIIGSGALVTTSLESTTDYDNLVPSIRDFSVTHVALSPSVLNMLLNILTIEDLGIMNNHLKYLMVAGEEFQVSLAKRVTTMLPDVQVDNLYGPTEATVYTTRYPILNAQELDQYVPIGVELDNVLVKIYGQDMEELEDGETGELLIGGAGVAIGYHNQPELTKERFVTIDDNRYYRTGDQALRLPDGNLRFLGRNDSQVQINGIRIELGEIESTLLDHINEIQMTKVIYYNKKLYCFFVTKRESLDDITIRQKLEQMLPVYMIPKIFISKDHLPITVNGKVDTNELIREIQDLDSQTVNETLSLIEAQVHQIFREQLNVKHLSKYDRFFDQGGNSLDSLTVLLKLERQFGLRLNQDFLYNYQTVAEVVQYLEYNQCGNEEKYSFEGLPIDLDDVLKQIECSFFNNQKRLGKPVREYDAYYLQKTYVFDNFTSNVELEMVLPNSISTKDILNAMKRLVNKAELLRSRLVRGESSLLFEEFESLKSLEFPVIRLSGSSEQQLEQLKHAKVHLHRLLMENVTDHLMHHGALFHSHSGTKLIWVFSHNITDQSNIHIIKKHLTELLYQGKTSYPDYPRYRDFISYINRNNNIGDVLIHELTVEMREAIQTRLEIEQSQEVLLLRTSNIVTGTSIERITALNFVISQLICHSTGSDKLTFSTLYNLREFAGIDVRSQIGDYHTTLCFVGRRNETMSVFGNRMAALLNEYRKGFQPMNVIFNTYPVMSEKQRELEAIYDLNPVVKTNYIGEVTSEQLPEVLASLQATKEKLNKFPVKKVYVTAFSKENEFYIAFLTTPALSHEVLDRFHLEVLTD